MERDATQETVIGWREYVALPEWDLSGILAKADTGARSSALDVLSIEELPGDRVRFAAVADRRHLDRVTTIEAPIARRGRVRSSFGKAHDRIFVEATIHVAGREIRTEVGLVSRHLMLCRMLLGRKSLEHVFLVDPGRCYIHGRRRRRVRKKKTP